VALALVVPAAPALAQDAGTGAPSAADAVQKAETLRTQRRYAEMLPLLMPFAASNNFDVDIMIGRAYEGLKLPPDCLRALDWYNKAIALQPNNVTGYDRRASGYDCLGVPYLDRKLADRVRVVDMADTGGKSPSAGQIGDLAGATLDMAAPGGQGAVDFARVRKGLELRSRAIAMTSTSTEGGLRDMAGRLMDRAELYNGRLANPGAARQDADEALNIVRTKLDMRNYRNWYSRAQINRRYAALGDTVIAPLMLPGFGIFRPTKAQLRNEAETYYTKYINAFEASGRDFAKYGSGVDAYTNRASNYSGMGGAINTRKAVADYSTSFALNPRNPARLWDRAQRQMDLGNNSAALADIQQYLAMNQGVDVQGVNGRLLALLHQLR
jgi:tetratricopeptide (TPR) repeat protein